MIYSRLKILKPNAGQAMLKTAALIPAAGSGSRLGKGPKAFLKLKEKTILETVITSFEGTVDEIILAVSADMYAKAKTYEKSNVKLIIGAETRQATVFKLINHSDADIVLIHDAARPFLKKQLIQESINTALARKAVVVTKPLFDSILNKKTQQSPNRDDYVAIQTPQTFNRELILDAHKNALIHSITASDDATLVRVLGHEVATIEGSSWLDKITSLDDYQRAIALAEVWDDS